MIDRIYPLGDCLTLLCLISSPFTFVASYPFRFILFCFIFIRNIFAQSHQTNHFIFFFFSFCYNGKKVPSIFRRSFYVSSFVCPVSQCRQAFCPFRWISYNFFLFSLFFCFLTPFCILFVHFYRCNSTNNQKRYNIFYLFLFFHILGHK